MTQPAPLGATWDPFRAGFFAAQAAVNGSLFAAEHTSSVLSKWLQGSARAAADWAEAVETAVREVEHAHDVEQLTAVATELLQRQLDGSIRFFSALPAGMFDTEMRLLRRARRHGAELVERAMPAAEAGSGIGNGWALAPLTPWGHLQEDWLSMTRRWMDVAAAPALARR